MEKAITMIRIVSLLLSTITQLKHMLMAGLNRLGGFYKAAAPAQEADASLGENNNNNNYILMLDGSSPSLVPVPVPLITATIKKTLPVVLFGEEEEEIWCAVCWEWIKRREEIRVLCNCSHVFHRECLDRWVDEDQVACPLCRSMLFPSTTNPWMVLRNNASHFSPPPQQQQQQQDHIHQSETTAAAAASISLS